MVHEAKVWYGDKSTSRGKRVWQEVNGRVKEMNKCGKKGRDVARRGWVYLAKDEWVWPGLRWARDRKTS